MHQLIKTSRYKKAEQSLYLPNVLDDLVSTGCKKILMIY